MSCIRFNYENKNSILNIISAQESSFTPQKYFFNKINAEYNPAADCPMIKKFLSEILRNPEDIKVAFELIGYTLFKKYFSRSR